MIRSPNLDSVEYGQLGCPARQRREVRAKAHLAAVGRRVVAWQRDSLVDVLRELRVRRVDRVVATREQELDPVTWASFMLIQSIAALRRDDIQTCRARRTGTERELHIVAVASALNDTLSRATAIPIRNS